MVSNSTDDDEEGHQHAIRILEVRKDRVASMQQKLSDSPKLLSKSAGHSNCCIFRVPQSLVDINGKTYQPHIVSIGPYHHGEPQLKMIEEHKWRFLGLLLNRVQTIGLGLEDFLKAVQPLESKAREAYAENIQFGHDDFVEMLVLDGCFVIELFRKIGGVVQVEKDDPLISMSWVYSFFLRDFIRLENQIPFFVLECLFDLTKMPGEESGPSFGTLALQFFNNALQRPEDVVSKYSNHRGKHLLDFLRSTFLPVDHDVELPDTPYHNQPNRFCRYIPKIPHHAKAAKPDVIDPPTHVIQCISKLRRAGIELRPGEPESFLTVTFNHGVIYMPTIAIDDFMSSFLINCVAYEQCHSHCSKHVTAYATLLDCLINTAKDVEYLCEKNIIENYFGTEAEIARFINKMGKDITFDIESSNFAGLFDEVNKQYQSGLHVQWASFKFTYFETPWSFIASLAALVLLILTVMQTVYTVLSYELPPG